MQSEALTEDCVELWLAPVAATHYATQLAGYQALLSVDEQARWRRFHRAVDRQRFLVGRAFLRTVLADRLGHRDPAALQFVQQLHGKPVLGGADAGRLQFNLSHTDDMIVLAVSRDILIIGGMLLAYVLSNPMEVRPAWPCSPAGRCCRWTACRS